MPSEVPKDFDSCTNTSDTEVSNASLTPPKENDGGEGNNKSAEQELEWDAMSATTYKVTNHRNQINKEIVEKKRDKEPNCIPIKATAGASPGVG